MPSSVLVNVDLMDVILTLWNKMLCRSISTEGERKKFPSHHLVHRYYEHNACFLYYYYYYYSILF